MSCLWVKAAPWAVFAVCVLPLTVVCKRAGPPLQLCDLAVCNCTTSETGYVNVDCWCNHEIKALHVGSPLDPSPPANTQNLTLCGCEYVTLFPDGIFHAFSLHTFKICSTQELSLTMGIFSTAKAVIIENVEFIMQIQPFTFHNGYNNDWIMESILLRNLYIGGIESHAFEGVRVKQGVLLDNVTVQYIDTKAINIEMVGNASFEIHTSNIRVLEHSALNIKAQNVLIVGCYLDQIKPAGISIRAMNFWFISNRILIDVDTGAFAVQGQHVVISHNYFQHLFPGALIEIRPENKLFLPISLDFTNNLIIEPEESSLLLDIDSYQNPTNVNFITITVSANSFICDCQQLQWLSLAATLANSSHAKFYKLFFQNGFCFETEGCDIPVYALHTLLDDKGQCIINVMNPYMCVTDSEPTQQLTSSITSMISQLATTIIPTKPSSIFNQSGSPFLPLSPFQNILAGHVPPVATSIILPTINAANPPVIESFAAEQMTSINSICDMSICKCTEGSDGYLNVDFSCNDLNKTLDLGDIAGLSVPLLTQNVTVNDCGKVILVPNHIFLSYLLDTVKISNIRNLTITSNLFSTARSVIIENVNYLSAIPMNAFSDSLNPDKVMEEIVFKNVSIGHIATHGINNIKVSKQMSFKNVAIDYVSKNGISVEMMQHSQFELYSSNFSILESQALNIKAESIIIEQCQIRKMKEEALNMISSNFLFRDNRGFLDVKAKAFSVQAQKIVITKNQFLHFSAGALEAIQLHVTNGMPPLFQFTQNVIFRAEKNSLHIDLGSHINILDFVNLSKNVFYCNCEYLRWLSIMTQSVNTSLATQYYKLFFKDGSCVEECHIPLSALYTITDQQGFCIYNTTFSAMCQDTGASVASHNTPITLLWVVFINYWSALLLRCN